MLYYNFDCRQLTAFLPPFSFALSISLSFLSSFLFLIQNHHASLCFWVSVSSSFSLTLYTVQMGWQPASSPQRPHHIPGRGDFWSRPLSGLCGEATLSENGHPALEKKNRLPLERWARETSTLVWLWKDSDSRHIFCPNF